jgi:hypothetical protein
MRSSNNFSKTKILHCEHLFHQKRRKVSRIVKYNLYVYEDGKNVCKNLRNQIM